MEWHHLIIPLVVVVGWVIKQIVSAQQEAAAQQEREKVRAGPQPVATAMSDDEVSSERTALDRRIEDAAERRREREQTDDEGIPAPVKRHIPMSVPTLVVAPVPRYQPPAYDRSTPEVRRIPRSELPRVVQPAPAKPAAAPPATPVRPRSKANVPAVPETAQVVLSLATPGRTSRVPPAVREALDLLKNPQALATAFVLREILDRPVALRQSRFQSSRGASAQRSSKL
jgi:hypothetical protein